jgi:3-oxoacyl-[acyl-carrier-protein] synthase-1
LREWPYFATGDGEEGGFVAAATQPDLGDGHWTEKAMELLAQPTYEALWQAKLFNLSPDLNKQRLQVRVYLSMPYADRVEDDSDAERIESFLEEFNLFLAEQMFVNEIKVYPAGHAAGLMALAQACQDVVNQETQIALVYGIDSLLDASYLQDAYNKDLLKTEQDSSGVIPGEAGVAIVVESSAQAVQRSATPLAAIRTIALDAEVVDRSSAATGEALTRCIQNVLQTAGEPQKISRVLVDLNGERTRFLEWATIETRCMHALPRNWQLQHPADCCGDTGAAFGVLAVALSASHCGSAQADAAGTLICCSSTRGERAAAAVFPV